MKPHACRIIFFLKHPFTLPFKLSMNETIFFSFILDHILLWLLLKGLQTDFLKVSMLDSLCEQDFAASLPRLFDRWFLIMQVLDPIDGTRGFLRGEDALYVVHFGVDIHATYCLSKSYGGLVFLTS